MFITIQTETLPKTTVIFSNLYVYFSNFPNPTVKPLIFYGCYKPLTSSNRKCTKSTHFQSKKSPPPIKRDGLIIKFRNHPVSYKYDSYVLTYAVSITGNTREGLLCSVFLLRDDFQNKVPTVFHHSTALCR